jgi:Tol biopolymer transport system component
VTAGVETTGGGEVLPLVAGPHDWAPAGDRVAWADATGPAHDLRVTTAGGGTVTVAAGAWPSWSPDGSKIAFNGGGGIATVSPSGSGLTTIVKSGRSYTVLRPFWSPTGTHVTYARVASTTWDVYRATSSGSSPTNLTSDVSGPAIPFGWR